MKHTLKLKIIIFAVVFLFSATSVFAAETFFETKNPEIRLGDKLEANFFLNTDNENINAIEGKIIFPEKLIELKEIKDGNSIINFWIERPKTSDGGILFSGIIPGGYSGKKGLILSVVFQSIQEGQGLVEARDIKVLLNDGEGTETGVTISNLQFVISKQALLPKPSLPEKKDIDMPEVFEPMVASDPTVFNGKYFLVFATQDKGSGIDRYEVCEGKRKCIVAESPYLLKNQNLDEEIVVKAIDKSGNERIITVSAQKPRLWYKNYAIPAIIILVIAIAYFVWKFLWTKRKK